MRCSSRKTWSAISSANFHPRARSRSTARTPRKRKRSKLMRVHAVTKNVPMSPQKVREVTRQIQGLPALQAQAVLAVVPRKSARLIAKTLKSAIANAEHNNKAKPEELVNCEAAVL